MFKQKNLWLILLVALAISGISYAQSEQPAAEPDQSTATDQEGSAAEITCAEILLIYEDAQAQPEEGVTEEELQDARTFALEITLWINGYLTGKHGVDLKTRPFEKEGLRMAADKVIEACAAEPETKLLDVLPKL